MGTISDNLTEDLMYYTLEYFVVNKQARSLQIWQHFEHDARTPLFTKRDVYDAVVSHRRNNMIKFLEKSDGGVADIENKLFEVVQRGINTYQNAKRERDRAIEIEKLNISVAKSTVNSNKWSPVWAGMAALFAFSSVVVSGFAYFKPTEELSPSIRQIPQSIQSQMQQVDRLRQSLDSVDLHLQQVLHSLKKP